jgi:hypothetical protein
MAQKPGLAFKGYFNATLAVAMMVCVVWIVAEMALRLRRPDHAGGAK